MRNTHRPTGRFFCLLVVMAAPFLAVPAETLAAPPAGPGMTQVVEGLFGHKSGADKRNTALTLVQNTIQATDAVTGKDIVDPAKFQDGLGKVIDGVVQCLNSSAWSKMKSSGQ
jgi:hypothetical protein